MNEYHNGRRTIRTMGIPYMENNKISINGSHTVTMRLGMGS